MEITIKPYGNAGNWYHVSINGSEPRMMHANDPKIVEILKIFLPSKR